VGSKRIAEVSIDLRSIITGPEGHVVSVLDEDKEKFANLSMRIFSKQLVNFRVVLSNMEFKNFAGFKDGEFEETWWVFSLSLPTHLSPMVYISYLTILRVFAVK
jgi:hypothetical protein